MKTVSKFENVPAGGISQGKTVPAAKVRTTSNVGGPCISTAIRRRKKANHRL